MAGLGFLSALGREHREILAELAARHAQSQIIDVACAVELEAYDTPAFHDRLVRAAGGGRVVESGSHDQLMDLGGRYADLFTLQASAYLASG
jgi:hypothetical protein